jgi:hypothetical protein
MNAIVKDDEPTQENGSLAPTQQLSPHSLTDPVPIPATEPVPIPATDPVPIPATDPVPIPAGVSLLAFLSKVGPGVLLIVGGLCLVWFIEFGGAVPEGNFSISLSTVPVLFLLILKTKEIRDLFVSAYGWSEEKVQQCKQEMAWSRREFYDVTNISLNGIQDTPEGPRLVFRTLMETPLDSLLLKNQQVERDVLEAAKKTTKDEPFLTNLLESKKSNSLFVLNNSILNALSERYREGALDCATGIPCVETKYMFGATCERGENVKQIKLRIMVCSPAVLSRIHSMDRFPRFEMSHHVARWNCLKRMAEHHHNYSPLLQSFSIYRPMYLMMDQNLRNFDDEDEFRRNNSLKRKSKSSDQDVPLQW